MIFSRGLLSPFWEKIGNPFVSFGFCRGSLVLLFALVCSFERSVVLNEASYVLADAAVAVALAVGSCVDSAVPTFSDSSFVCWFSVFAFSLVTAGIWGFGIDF